MYIEITTGIEVDERAIIKEYTLDNNSDGIEIRMAVDDYIAGLDDSDYFIMTQEDAQEQVVDKIKELLGIESEEECEEKGASEIVADSPLTPISEQMMRKMIELYECQAH